MGENLPDISLQQEEDLFQSWVASVNEKLDFECAHTLRTILSKADVKDELSCTQIIQNSKWNRKVEYTNQIAASTIALRAEWYVQNDSEHKFYWLICGIVIPALKAILLALNSIESLGKFLDKCLMF